MMYDLMIENWEDEKYGYEQQRDQLLNAGHFGEPVRILNTKIEMCRQFIQFLKQCEQQELDLLKEAEHADIYELNGLKANDHNLGLCEDYEKKYGSERFCWQSDSITISITFTDFSLAEYKSIIESFR